MNDSCPPSPSWRAIGAATLALAAIVLLAPGPGLAFTGDIKKDPRDVVSAYVSLDAKGVRLEAVSWETLKPYIAWKDEPAWGKVVVVESYDVSDDVATWEIVSTLEVVIPVQFKVLGFMYWETAAFAPGTENEEVRFRVKAVKDRWRIVEPMIQPHVSRTRLMGFVKQAMLDEPDATRKAQLAELRDHIKGAP